MEISDVVLGISGIDLMVEVVLNKFKSCMEWRERGEIVALFSFTSVVLLVFEA